MTRKFLIIIMSFAILCVIVPACNDLPDSNASMSKLSSINFKMPNKIGEITVLETRIYFWSSEKTDYKCDISENNLTAVETIDKEVICKRSPSGTNIKITNINGNSSTPINYKFEKNKEFMFRVYLLGEDANKKQYILAKTSHDSKNCNDTPKTFINDIETVHVTVCAIDAVTQQLKEEPITVPSGSNVSDAEFSVNIYEEVKKEVVAKTKTDYITKLYKKYLLRDPENEGLQYWLNNSNNCISLSKRFITEASKLPTSTSGLLYPDNKDYISKLYQSLLEREPDADGLKYWVDQLNLNVDRVKLVGHIVGSQEGLKICQLYGLETSPEVEPETPTGNTEGNCGYK